MIFATKLRKKLSDLLKFIIKMFKTDNYPALLSIFA